MVSPPPPSQTSPAPPPPPNVKANEKADEHEHDVEAREAYQYWGYLFKSDKTGTDKLKSLLRGLKDVIVCVHLYCLTDATSTVLTNAPERTV